MDGNKLAALREVGYRVLRTCGGCAHARIPRGQEFGTCAVHSYSHLKHTGPDRELSVTRQGTCPSWEEAPAATRALGPYAALRQRESGS